MSDQFRTITVPSLRNSRKVARVITRMGKQGWELVDKQSGGILFGSARLVFRRPEPTAAQLDPTADVSGLRTSHARSLLESGEITRAEYNWRVGQINR